MSKVNPLLYETPYEPLLDFGFKEPEPYIRVLGFIQSTYVRTGNFPSKALVLKEFRLKFPEFIEMLPQINAALSKRGYDQFIPRDDNNRTSSDLDPFFIIAVDIMCDTNDKRSNSVKLKAAGLSTQRWKVLLKDTLHLEYYRTKLTSTFSESLDAAQLGLAKNVESGDLPSIKYLHEYTGVYRPNQETAQNIMIIIARLMEILSQRMSPQILAEIADEFDKEISNL